MIRPSSLRRTAIVLAALAGVGGWGTSASAAEIAPEVADAIDAGLGQRVLIHVGDADRLKALPIREPDHPDRLHAVATAIDRAVEGFADLIDTGEIRVEHTFRLQPTLAAEVTSAGLAALAADPRVRLIEPDRRWQYQTLEGIELIGADLMHQQGIDGSGTAVAIIDSGIDYMHPTLGGGQIPNPKVVFGLDTADGDADPMDCNGHGTAVASVAAGVSYQWGPNRRFAGGVAPGAKILAYKVTADDECYAATTGAIVAAIEDAILRRNGNDYRLVAINISLGGGRFFGPCDAANVAYAQAVDAAADADIMVVAASGNDGYTDALNAPACLSRAISVGSAWDTDPGWVPYRFCLNEGCSRWCDDSYRWQRAVTCYSNSNPHLDLIAPSEFLRVAAAGNVTIDFGGTSGAAAYVTGAASLVAQALDRTDPESITLLLDATGTPTMDDKNGLIRSVIDLPAAIASADEVTASDDPVLPISRSPDHPTRSTIFVDRSGVVGSVSVLVDLAHPATEQLRLLLRAPDGTEIILHDRNPDGPTLVGTYPRDLESVDSLGRLSGITMRGDWTLTVEDLTTGGGEDESPILLGWALKIDEPATPPYGDTTLVVPVVAHTAGALGTHWQSSLRLFNSSPTKEAEVRLFLIPPSGSDDFSPRQSDVIVPHGSVLTLDDVVERSFGLDEAHGSLRVQDRSATVVHGASRTFTTGDNGTYGQHVVPEVGLSGAVGTGDPSIVVLPTTGPDQRVNVGITEIAGEPVTIAVTLIDSNTGGAIGPSTFHQVDPYANIQLNGILPLADPAADPYVAVTVVQGEGRVTAYGSVIDNRSGDATYIRGSAPRVTPYLVVPVVARTRGHAGTRWRSDLRLLNRGSFSVHVDLELRFHGSIGVPPVVRSLELQPGQARSIEDVVGEFFGFESAIGSLRLVPTEGATALHATSRTANHGGSVGTYGQYVPAVAASDGLHEGGVLLHVDQGPQVRTNLGLTETEGHGVTIDVRLLDQRGQTLGSTARMSLGAWEAVQLNDIFGFLGASDEGNARIEISPVTGDGGYFAYVSVIDSESGDAIFVPVQALDPS